MGRSKLASTCTIWLFAVACGGNHAPVSGNADGGPTRSGNGTNAGGSDSGAAGGSAGTKSGQAGRGGAGGSAGGPDATVGSGTEDAAARDAAATDASAHDSGSQDAGTHDSGSQDAGPNCMSGAACALTSGDNGLYDASCVCQPCASVDATGDSACTATYGSGYLCLSVGASNACVAAACRSTSGSSTPHCQGGQICSNANQCVDCASSADCTAVAAYGTGYVCAGGVCAAGECLTSADCHALGGSKDGQLCTGSRSCAGCQRDDDCSGDAYYGSASVGATLCDSSTHKCVSNACTGTDPSACTGSRLCCSSTCLPDTTYNSSTGAGKSCCADADCNGTAAPNCNGHACSTCASVTENSGTMTYDFVVDPSGASDLGTSGVSSPASCRFKTLTHALQYVATFNGVTTSTPARIFLWGDIGASTGEAFPLVLPTNVRVIGQPQSGTTPPKVLVPSAGTAFRLSASNIGLSNLVIDGADNSTNGTRYATGVLVVAPSSGTTPSGVEIDHVTVQNSLGDGIVIGTLNGSTLTGAGATVGPGVHVTGAGSLSSGAGTVRSNGLMATGTATVTIVGGSGADQTSFNTNSQHGIAVRGQAVISVNESLDLSDPTSMAYDGSPVTANGNDAAGLAIAQIPVGAASGASTWTSMPTNTVTGLVSLNTSTGNGIRIEGGSKIVLRRSVAYGSAGDGVLVLTSTHGAGGSTADINFLGAIDLGTSGNAGGNVLQVPGVGFNVTAPHGQKPNQGAGVCLSIAPVASGGQTLSAEGNWLVASGSNAETDCSTAADNTAVVQRNSCRSIQSTASRLGIPTSVGVTGRTGGTNANTIDATHCMGQ